MERRVVPSGHIVSIGYSEAEMILEVEFAEGKIYRYYDVPSSEYLALMNASSHGAYLNQYIRNTYRYEQM